MIPAADVVDTLRAVFELHNQTAGGPDELAQLTDRLVRLLSNLLVET